MEYYNTVNSRYAELIHDEEIYPVFKIELLDYYENATDDITDRLSSDNAGEISINYQQGVRRTTSITFIDRDGVFIPSSTGVIWFDTKFKLYIGISDHVNGDIYWFAQGVYCLTDPTVDRDSRIVTLNAVDKYGRFGSETGYSQLDGTYVIDQGTDSYTAVRGILTMDAGNGKIIDPVDAYLDKEFVDYPLPYEIDKSPGSYLSDILIEIANVQGADTYYDTDGHMRYDSGTLDMTYSTVSPIWEFSDGDLEYSESSLSFRLIDAINSVTVVGNNSSSNLVFMYTAENHNALSPTCVERIGTKAYYEDSSTIASDKEAKDYAEYLLNSKSILQQTITFSSPLVPHLDVNKVISVTDSYYGFEKENFIIQSITMPFDCAGKMQITASKISDLPYYSLTSGGS